MWDGSSPELWALGFPRQAVVLGRVGCCSGEALGVLLSSLQGHCLLGDKCRLWNLLSKLQTQGAG